MAEGAKTKIIHRRHRYIPEFFATLCWMVPMMLVMAAAGYYLGRDVVSPKVLKSSDVPYDKPRPIRVLSPDEVQAGKDQPSHVWTQGVQPSDIPPLDTPPPTNDTMMTHRRTRHGGAQTPTAAPDTTATPDDTATPDTPATTPDTTPDTTPGSMDQSTPDGTDTSTPDSNAPDHGSPPN
jgi:hypothetical protein